MQLRESCIYPATSLPPLTELFASALAIIVMGILYEAFKELRQSMLRKNIKKATANRVSQGSDVVTLWRYAHVNIHYRFLLIVWFVRSAFCSSNTLVKRQNGSRSTSFCQTLTRFFFWQVFVECSISFDLHLYNSGVHWYIIMAFNTARVHHCLHKYIIVSNFEQVHNFDGSSISLDWYLKLNECIINFYTVRPYAAAHV